MNLSRIEVVDIFIVLAGVPLAGIINGIVMGVLGYPLYVLFSTKVGLQYRGYISICKEE